MGSIPIIFPIRILSQDQARCNNNQSYKIFTEIYFIKPEGTYAINLNKQIRKNKPILSLFPIY